MADTMPTCSLAALLSTALPTGPLASTLNYTTLFILNKEGPTHHYIIILAHNSTPLAPKSNSLATTLSISDSNLSSPTPASTVITLVISYS
jgi:hypothetical protein